MATEIVVTDESTSKITSEERAKMHGDFLKIMDSFKEQRKAYTKTQPSKHVIYCQATYAADFEDTQRCVNRVSPHVDYTIIAEDGTLTDEQRNWLKMKGCIVRTYRFQDNLPMMRNEYLEEAKKLDLYAWVLCSDPDELFCEELCKEIRSIVKEAEAEGYNMLGIHARDQWLDLDKLDQGEKEKEAPYKESGFWKYLLFKISPRFRYEGIGEAKNVHETWYSPDVHLSSMHLDTRFYYVHRKVVQKIWRNATRNLFIGGSGDNLGALNPTWVELRKITDALGLLNWSQFEEALKKGSISQGLKEFIVKHRSDSQYPWEAEIRELFKWYFWMHPEENTGNWVSEYTPPPVGSRAEVENYVIGCYFQVLGRAPDEKGKAFYTDAIISGKIKREELPYIFFGSDEYKQKCARRFKGTVAFCVMGYREVLPTILITIMAVKGYVDEIHVQGDDFTPEDLAVLAACGAHVHIEEWKDDFSAYKNKLYSHAKTGWVMVCDHDEIPTQELLIHLKEILEKSQQGTKYNMAQFDVIDVKTLQDKVMSEVRNPEGKPLLHVNVPDAYYGNPHVWLKPGYFPWKPQKCPYAYKHVKALGSELPRSVRNVFMGGGGDNAREKNPLWPELRRVAEELGLTTWAQFDVYLRKGKIDPRLLNMLKELAEIPWKDTELEDPLRYYQQLHPEEFS